MLLAFGTVHEERERLTNLGLAPRDVEWILSKTEFTERPANMISEDIPLPCTLMEELDRENGLKGAA